MTHGRPWRVDHSIVISVTWAFRPMSEAAHSWSYDNNYSQTVWTKLHRNVKLRDKEPMVLPTSTAPRPWRRNTVHIAWYPSNVAPHALAFRYSVKNKFLKEILGLPSCLCYANGDTVDTTFLKTWHLSASILYLTVLTRVYAVWIVCVVSR